MKQLIALGGSNSKESINKKLAVYAATQVQETTVRVIDLNNFEMPIYGIDLENAQGIPLAATQLNTLLSNADGFVISLAEHNGSYAVAFKNTLDWLSRIDKQVWKNKPLLLLATSPGARGGQTVLNAAKTSFPHLGATLIAHCAVPSFYEQYSENGIQYPALSEAIASFQEAL